MELKAKETELFISVTDEGNALSGGLTVDDIRTLLE